MLVYTFKASSIRFAAICLSCVLCAVALMVFVPGKNSTVTVSAGENEVIKSGKIKNADDMNKFISSLGWTVSENPIEIVDVTIPYEFNSAYLKYNEIQKAQGLNLEKYKGKVAKRYTYVVTNYPGTDEKVFLNLIFFKNKVIAGDVCSADVSGFIHGLHISNAEK